MSSGGVSDAKRKRLAALDDRQQKPGKGGGKILGKDKQGQELAGGGLSPAAASLIGAGEEGDETPKPQGDLPDPSAFLESFLKKLLAGNVNKPDEVIETRVKDKVVLLDNPLTSKSRRDAQTVRSLKHMSLRQHRQNRSFEIPRQLQRLELYEPLHALWREYIEKLTSSCSGQVLLSRLLTADYHGAPLAVVASRDPTYIGTEGLVVRETQNTFQILTAQNRLRVVPKRGSVFQLKLRDTLVSLFGNQLIEERTLTSAGKRNKPKVKNALPTIEL